MTSEEQTVSKRLAQVEKSGALNGLTIEIWRGGGLPPPLYKSDQIRILTVDRKDSVEFASLHFDSHYEPAAVQDKWIIPASSSDIAEAAHLLISSNLLTAKFAEEQDPGFADAFSFEIIISVDKVEVKRRYYRKLPEALNTLKTFADRMTESAKSSGPPKLFHQGRQVN